MRSLTNEQIRLLAFEVAESVSAGSRETVVQMLGPLLDTKFPFSKLDRLGREIGAAGVHRPQEFFEAFDQIVEYNSMGGFVVVGQALISFLENSVEKVIQKSREYIVKGDRWYVCDIISERSLGQALVDYFDETLPYLRKFLEDDDRWVRRSVGVAVHFFSKKVLDKPEKTRKLLELIESRIEDKQIDVVKGIGWGLKTIGKHHPDILVQFLKKQIRGKKSIPRLTMKKAVTYLDQDHKREIENVQSL